jgi:UDP-3-O-[3-hydroxymyristoyl] glucosamine N-acyltransferase
MAFSVFELAQKLNGKAIGKIDFEVVELRALDEASSGAICPYWNKKKLSEVEILPGAVLAGSGLAESALEAGVFAAIVHEHPQVVLSELIELFHPTVDETPGIHSGAFVDPAAEVHSSAWIGPCAVVEAGAVIGARSWIGPGAIILSPSRIGQDVRIGPGSVIGADGFGFLPTTGDPIKVRQVGRVVIEDGVEIGANACVDRGTLGTTLVAKNSKIDNLVQVGHNVRIGRNVIIAGQAGLAGSVVIGDGAILGGQTGIADQLKIGAGAMVAAHSGVVGNVGDGEIVAGYPALPVARWRRAMAKLSRDAIRKAETKLGNQQKK